MNNYFFSQIDKNPSNNIFLESLEEYANEKKIQLYVISAPLTDQKYNYDYKDGFILLSPKKKIAFITYKNKDNLFNNYIEDVIEDISSISDKYQYKDIIGRPRIWKMNLIVDLSLNEIKDVSTLFENLLNLNNSKEIRQLDLLISLFIGSINDASQITINEPESLLEKVKYKIQLFDGDQTRFIYESSKQDQKRITIQGLSGTGKTELLLHKLKDLYIIDKQSKICFTCHNKILADNLKKRIPQFFNFMKVEQQIEWNARLWCVNAWGRYSNVHSGAYRYICSFYEIPFYSYTEHSFKDACQRALQILQQMKKDEKEWLYAFTYMFIDESQDFDEIFFELCEFVTEKKVYVAGDIFQSIFEERKTHTIKPDYLLSKCYRTDPKTLMFAHALGMGLFEKKKLWWLDKDEWEMCGYNVKIERKLYNLTREPLRRFEDVDEDFESLQIGTIKDFGDKIVELLINKIISEFPTTKPEDIGIIFLDQENYIYKLAEDIANCIRKKLGWNINIAYETKEKRPQSVFISNRNNVKGLEFPFVICYTRQILSSSNYRNTIYTMLSRSFLRSYLVFPQKEGTGLTDDILEGAKNIMKNKMMSINEPTEQEKKEIKARFVMEERTLSYYERIMNIFKKLGVKQELHKRIFKTIEDAEMHESDDSKLEKFIKNLVDCMS
jgi:hypothetical protein